jgi:type II secretory pathway component PulK
MNKPGVVLISTLLIVMVMSVISIQISKNFFLSIQRDSYIDFKNHSLQLLLSSEKEALKSIQKEITSSNEKLTNKDPVLNQSYFFSNELATIQVDVSDASNCFNLNSIFIKKIG